MSFTVYKSAGTPSQVLPPGVTEFDILKAKHQFLRDEDDPNTGAEADEGEGESSNNTRTRNRTNNAWEDQLAKKYYDSLYREFAVCDLKHYKSGNFALRWRTEEEVLEGIGEETCGNTRCGHHFPGQTPTSPRLNTVELPFAYEEHGVRKEALVKVVLCDACLRKLMYKRGRHSRKAKDREDNIPKKEERENGEERSHALDRVVRVRGHDDDDNREREDGAESHRPDLEDERTYRSRRPREDTQRTRNRNSSVDETERKSTEGGRRRERYKRRRSSRSRSPREQHERRSNHRR